MMDTLLGISAYAPTYGVGASSAVTPTNRLLASVLGLSSSGLFGNESTVVELSGLSQLLSASTTFQDQLRSLQPGTATSGGGQNFGTDFASLAAETQNFVDAFNSLQSNIANINATSNLLGGSVAGATGLSQSLNAQAQGGFVNGSSALTSLSQLGIELKPAALPGGSSSLSIDLNKLQSAFNSDATGAFSLLSSAASTFNNLAGGFVAQQGSQYSTIAAQAQSSTANSSLINSLFPQTQNSGYFDSLLALGASNGGANLQQVVLALNQYSLVSTLLG